MTDDVFILDAYDNVFVWIGEDARPEEKTMATETARVGVSLPELCFDGMLSSLSVLTIF